MLDRCLEEKYASIGPRYDALMTDRRLYRKHEVQEYKHPVPRLVITKPACGEAAGISNFQKTRLC